ncbi:uncharacterized protein LOC107045520 [Diachasma alloeum]|uniref:uncharacterized protein LOC107045520 n=1 Tax=Diachasma alloeum TaxID=454923 RepID=UPI0007382ECE|nr:uncharacterized protein LOC107045520 [Diachasma alloeum]
MSDPDTEIEKQAVDNQQDARGAAAQPTKKKPSPSTIPKVVISETEDEANIPSTQRIQHIKTRYSEVIGLKPAAGLTVHQEILLRQLKFRVESITHIYKELTTTIINDEDVTVEELDEQKEILETYWAEFHSQQEGVIEYLPHDHSYLTEGIFEPTAATKEQSIKLISKLKGRLSKKTQPASNSPGQEHPDKLKRLDLKAFDGTPSQCKEFRDLFTSLVGSKSTIAPVEKLIRLKSSLRGPPATLISTLDINDQNYEKAWQKLKAKYDDPRLVAQYLFNRILELPKITKATQEKLNHNTAAAVESLDQLREVVGLSDANLIEQMIAHLLRRSLDAETLKQWELKLGDSRDFPSLKEFVGFVEACGRRINAGSELHATQETNIADRKSLKKKKSSYAAATQQDSNAERLLPRNCCAMCKEKHFISECQKFRELPPTKVAPIKRMTIPRLELTAALLLTQLVASTQRMLQLDHPETHLWSDSAVTLAWIRSHASRWKDFVHNRVVKIQETLPNAIWRHDPEEWPQSTIDGPAMDISEVAKEAKPARAHPVAPKVNELAELLTRYSSMAWLLAVIATINRAIDRFRRLPTPPGPILSTRELNEARLFWRNQQLPRGHQLAKLTPTLDELNIMRLGGRLKNSDLHPEETHPIILPRQSRFTTLVIEEAHRRTLHGGTQLTLAYTRQRYWIIGGRGTVRAYILRCAICTRHRVKQAQQQMGQLPATRVSPSRAFLHTGVDYAGPFQILTWRPTNAQPGQLHIAVFVRFTTSAVHLELVNRQTTEAFLGAYKRFTGRRGIPAVMYSDNATTFTSAAEVLERLYHQASRENQRIQAALATNGTQ